MQINFAIPPIFHFSRWLGEFFFPLSKLRNFYHFINQLVRKVENFLGIFRQSLSICLSIRPSVCLPPAAAFHPYCPQWFGNNFRRKYTQSRAICQSVVVKVASHVCGSGLFAPVIPLFHYHGCRSWVFAPVV